jgi:Flp pilus assembly protein TadG
MKMTTMIERLRTRRQFRDDEAGQALVELALTLPLLFLLVWGSVEMARGSYAAIELSNSARAAVQYGAQSVGYAHDTAGITTTAENDANDIYAINPSNFSVSSGITYICSDGTNALIVAGQAAACSSSTAVVEQILTVNTQATFDPLVHIPGTSGPFTLKGRAVQKVLIQ